MGTVTEYKFLSNEIIDAAKPIVTVITPYYNNAGLLTTIESVLQQDCLNIEYIIADDSSKNIDVTIKAITELLNKRELTNFFSIRLLKQEKNIGTVKNLNNAIKCSSGDILYFLAADDIFYNESVLTEWTKFFKNNGTFVSTAKRVICKKTTGNVQCIRPKKQQIKNIKYLSPQDLYFTMAYENYILGCCTAYKKQCFEKYGYLDESYKLLEDHPMILSLLKKDVQISFWDEIAIYYMDDGISSAAKFNETFEQDVIKLLEKEALHQGDNVEKIIGEHKVRKNKLVYFYEKWREKRYWQATKIYPKQTIKELLKPVRGLFVKIYLYVMM